MGISGEAGEISAAIERWIYYGKPLDLVNVKEELGDLLWYTAEMCNALGFDMGEVMAANIAKLRQRYPDRYTDTLAAEENRDRAAERAVLESETLTTDNSLKAEPRTPPTSDTL
jgi:NTP pyrophosphatase (non-canonical NTP hydrolase)